MQVTEHAQYNITHLGELPLKHETLIEGCKHLKGKWFISDGTLLGFVRENDFIPKDTDIDVAVMGFEDISLPFDLIRTSYWEGKQMQQAYIDRKTNTIFDIYFYYPDIIEGKWTTVGGYGKLPLSEYEITTIETKYGVFNAPDPQEKYLEERYGDWKTPKQDKGKHV